MYSPKQMGEIIRSLRGDMPLREFAKKCDMSHTTIDNLERGEDPRTGKPTQVKMATLQKIADACNVQLSFITGEMMPESDIEVSALALFGRADSITLSMFENAVNNIRRILAENDAIGKHTPRRLSMIMDKRKISPETLSERTGIDRLTLGAFLDGRMTISDDIFRILAIALGVSVDFLKCKTNIPGVPPQPRTYFENLVTAPECPENSSALFSDTDDDTFDTV